MSLTIDKLNKLTKANENTLFLVRDNGVEYKYSFKSLIDDLLQNPIGSFNIGSNENKFNNIIFDGTITISDLILNSLNVQDAATINTLQSTGKIILNEDSTIESSSSDNLNINSNGTIEASSLEAESLGGDIRIVSATKFKVDKNMSQKEVYKLFEQKGISSGRYEGGDRIRNTFKDRIYSNGFIAQPPCFTCLDYDMSKIGHSMPINFCGNRGSADNDEGSLGLIETQQISSISRTLNSDNTTYSCAPNFSDGPTFYPSPFGFIYQLWPIASDKYLIMLGQLQTLQDVCNDPNFAAESFNTKVRIFPAINDSRNYSHLPGVIFDGFYILSLENLQKLFTEEGTSLRYFNCSNSFSAQPMAIQRSTLPWIGWNNLKEDYDWSSTNSANSANEAYEIWSAYGSIKSYKDSVLVSYRNKYLTKQKNILSDFDKTSFEIPAGEYTVDGVTNTTVPLKAEVVNPTIISFYDVDSLTYYLLIDAVDEEGNYKVHVYSFTEGKDLEVQYKGDAEAFNASLSYITNLSQSEYSQYSVTRLAQALYPKANIHKVDGKYQIILNVGTSYADVKRSLFESTDMIHWYEKIDFDFTTTSLLPALKLQGKVTLALSGEFKNATVSSIIDRINDAIFIPSSELSAISNSNWKDTLSDENKKIGVQAFTLVNTNKKLTITTTSGNSTSGEERIHDIQRLYVLNIPLAQINERGVYVADSSEDNPQNTANSNWYQCGILANKEFMNLEDWKPESEDKKGYNCAISLAEQSPISYGVDKYSTGVQSLQFSNLEYIESTGELFYNAAGVLYKIKPSETLQSFTINDSNNIEYKNHYLYKATQEPHFFNIDTNETESNVYIFRKIINLSRNLQDSLGFLSTYSYVSGYVKNSLGVSEGIYLNNTRYKESTNGGVSTDIHVPFNLGFETLSFGNAKWDPQEEAILFSALLYMNNYTFYSAPLYYYPKKNNFVLAGPPISTFYIENMKNTQNTAHGNFAYPLLNSQNKAFTVFNGRDIYLKGSQSTSFNLTVSNPSLKELYKTLIEVFSSYDSYGCTWKVGTSYSSVKSEDHTLIDYPLIASKIYDCVRLDFFDQRGILFTQIVGDINYRGLSGGISYNLIPRRSTSDEYNFLPTTAAYFTDILAPEDPIVQIEDSELTFSNLSPIIDTRAIIIKKDKESIKIYIPWMSESIGPDFRDIAHYNVNPVGGIGELLSSQEIYRMINKQSYQISSKTEVSTKELLPFITINKDSEQPIGATFYWNFPAQIVAKDLNSKITLSETIMKYFGVASY